MADQKSNKWNKYENASRIHKQFKVCTASIQYSSLQILVPIKSKKNKKFQMPLDHSDKN